MLWVRVLHFTSTIGPIVAFSVAETRKKREKLLKNVAKCMEHKIPLLININCFFNALNVLWHFKRAQCGGHFFFCRRQFLASSKGNRTVYILYWVCALNSSSIEKCRDLMCAAILVWRHSVSFYLGICRILCRFFLLELFYLLPTRSFLSPFYSYFFISFLLALFYHYM